MTPQTYPVNITKPLINIVTKEERTLNHSDDTENTTDEHVSTPGTEGVSNTQLPVSQESFPTPGEIKLKRSTDDYEYDPEMYYEYQSIQDENIFTVTYWMFYPYNRGKPVCSINLGFFLGRMVKPRDKMGKCHGEEVTMGDHVGDWEHVSIQFKVSLGGILANFNMKL